MRGDSPRLSVPMKSFFILTIFRLLALLPLSLVRALGKLAGHLLWLFNTEARQVTELNLRLCFPELSDEERLKLTHRRLQMLCIVAFEFGPVWLWSGQRVVERVHSVTGEELLQAGLADGRGVVLLAPHIGNWEVLGLHVSAQGHPMTTMYQPPDLPAMDSLMQASRQRLGMKLVPTNTGGVKALLKALKAGEIIGVLPDQVPPRGTGGEFAPFFGHPALTMTLLHSLVQRTGATVLSFYAIVNNAGGWDLTFAEVPAAMHDADVQHSLCALNQAVEACARVYPEQYQWEYKRFRKRPDGVNPYSQLKKQR